MSKPMPNVDVKVVDREVVEAVVEAIEDFLSREEGEPVKEILDEHWSVARKVVKIVYQIGFENLKNLLDEKDTKPALGKLTIFVENYSPSRTAEAGASS